MVELVGKTITEIWVAPGEESIHFLANGGEWVSYDTYGDCCSETWFADIIQPWAVIGREVLGVLELPLPHDGQDRTRQEVDAVYGLALTSSYGVCTIAYRNSSNGYYGGNLCSARDNAPPEGSKRITTEDWSA